MADLEEGPRGSWRTAKRAWTLIGVVIAVAVLLGAWLYLSDDRSYSCSYELLAQSSSGGVFTLYVPIPTNYAGTATANLSEQAIFSGALSKEIVETPYGAALKVAGEATLDVEWSSRSISEVDWGFFLCITLHNDSANITTGMTSTWLFCDDPNVTVHLSYEASSRHHEAPWFVSGSDTQYEFLMASGTKGWRPVPTEYEFEVSN
jgi:hypothetical protein